MKTLNPYQPPLIPAESQVRAQGERPTWRRAVALAVRLLSYPLSIFAATISLTVTIEALKSFHVQLDWALWIGCFASLIAMVCVFWLGHAATKWITRQA